MKMIRIHEHGGPKVLRLREIEAPEPGPGEVRVGVHAAGLNFVDIYYRRGNIPAPLPFTLGSEGAGIVEAIGEGVEELKPGDRVAYTLHPVLVQFFDRRQTEPISTSPYAASTASHTCRIMAPGPVISDVSNCPFLILFANSIPLNVTSAFPKVVSIAENHFSLESPLEP